MSGHRSRWRRLIAGSLLLALVAACGAQIEIAADVDTTTVDTPVPRPPDFSIWAPDQVTVGDEFLVEFEADEGLSISLKSVEGGCAEVVPWRLLALAAGQCIVSAGEVADDGPNTVPDQTATIIIVAPLPPDDDIVGSFVLVAPPSAVERSPFTVSAIDVIGGPVEVTMTADSPCTRRPNGTYVGDRTGTCRFSARQLPLDGYTTASSDGREVQIVAPPVGREQGTFVVTDPGPVVLGVPFTVRVSDVVGGSVGIRVAPNVSTGIAGGSTNGPSCQAADSNRRVGPGETADFEFTATTYGICTLVAFQEPAERHDAAADQPIVVAVLQPKGSVVSKVSQNPVAVGDQGEIVLTVVGPEPTVTRLSGPCSDPMRVSGERRTFEANAVGRCQFRIVQPPSDDYKPAEPQTIAVDVVKRKGSFDIAGPTSATTLDTFALSATNVVGGKVEIFYVDGPCRQYRPPIITAYATQAPVPGDGLQGRDISGLKIQPTGEGRCEFKGVQDRTNTYERSEKEHRIAISKGVGSFTATFVNTPSRPEPDSFVSVRVEVQRGGNVSVRSSGPCERIKAPSSGSLWQFLATGTGTCSFDFIQEPDDQYVGGSHDPLRLLVKDRGVYKLDQIGNPFLGKPFKVVVVIDAGGPVTLIGSGACSGEHIVDKRYQEVEFTVDDVGICVVSTNQEETTTHWPMTRAPLELPVSIIR